RTRRPYLLRRELDTNDSQWRYQIHGGVGGVQLILAAAAGVVERPGGGHFTPVDVVSGLVDDVFYAPRGPQNGQWQIQRRWKGGLHYPNAACGSGCHTIASYAIRIDAGPRTALVAPEEHLHVDGVRQQHCPRRIRSTVTDAQHGAAGSAHRSVIDVSGGTNAV